MRALLSPRWLAFHAALILVLPVMGWLGWWQWRGGLEGHSLQTTGYAFQWWVFCLFAIGLWWRVVRDARRRLRTADGKRRPTVKPQLPAPRPRARTRKDGLTGVPLISYRAPSAAAIEDESPLGQYNAYLAELNARAVESQRSAQGTDLEPPVTGPSIDRQSVAGLSIDGQASIEQRTEPPGPEPAPHAADVAKTGEAR